MWNPIPVTLLKMQPHYSQSSREHAIPSSGTSPLASYEEVPPALYVKNNCSFNCKGRPFDMGGGWGGVWVISEKNIQQTDFERKNFCREIYTWLSQMVGPLVPRPIRFGSRGPREEVRRFPPVRLGYVTEVSRPRRPGKSPYRDHSKTLSVWNLELFPKTSLRIHL